MCFNKNKKEIAELKESISNLKSIIDVQAATIDELKQTIVELKNDHTNINNRIDEVSQKPACECDKRINTLTSHVKNLEDDYVMLKNKFIDAINMYHEKMPYGFGNYMLELLNNDITPLKSFIDLAGGNSDNIEDILSLISEFYKSNFEPLEPIHDIIRDL